MRNTNIFVCILFLTFLFCQSCQDEIPLSNFDSEMALNSTFEKSNFASGDLTEEETFGLIHMRLEEKLARDVYTYLGNMYDQKLFLNIVESEEKHIDAMKKLLDKYFIEDPVIIDELGVFPDVDFQALYDSYILQGQTSVQEAIAVGIAIEELDIADFDNLLLITDNPDIVKVYEKLLAASKVHLSKLLTHVKLETAEDLLLATIGDLTDEETLGLIHMRLEEKLARDVYIFLGNMYDQKIFLNIVESEDKHIDAMVELLNKYFVEDPVIIDEFGVFPDVDFQALYDSFILQGQTSAQEAIAVGIAIEELDIADFEDLLLITDNPDIVKVYEKLLDASKVHLSKFLTHVKLETADNNSSSLKRISNQKPKNHIKVKNYK